MAILLAIVAGGRAAGQETLELPHERPGEEKKAPQLTRAPALVKFVPAAYPKEARALGLMGEVGLELDLGADGRVTGVRVVKPADHGFDEAAALAARGFVFSPAELDGVPAAVTLGYVYHFVLAAPAKVARAAPTTAPVRVFGTVLERSSKRPLSGASITISSLPGDLTAGEGGRFSARLPPGLATVSVFATGYEPLSREVHVFGKRLDLTFYLRPKLEGFHTVVKTKTDQDVVERYTLDREEVRRAPGTFGDPLHVITDLPGVARSPFDLGFLVVRGADPEDTDFYLDGLEVPLIYHFGGGPAVINPEFLDKIDFYPGGQGARYGHAIGGVVDVTSRTLETDRPHVVADVNTAFASLFADAPIGDDTEVAVAGRRSYFDLLLKPLLGGSSTVVVPYFWDYQFKIDHGKATDRNSFGLMLYGSNDTLEVVSGGVVGVAPFSLDYHSQFHRLVGRWSYRKDGFSSDVKPMVGTENDNFGFGPAGLTHIINTLALRHDMSYEVSPQLHFNFGEDVSYQVVNYQLELPTIPDYVQFPGSSIQQGSSNLSEAFHQLDVGPWIEAVLKLPRGIKIVPGLRFDEYHVPSGERASFDPRLAIRWQLSEKLTVKGSAGLYHQPPLAEYFDAQYGTPGLSLLAAWQYSGGFEYKILPPLTLDMLGFYSDRFYLLNGSFGPNLPGQTSFNNNGMGRAYGLEVFLHHDITSRLFGWLSYTFSRSEFSPGMNQQWGLSPYDETHILTAVASYTLGWGFMLGARFRLVTGTPLTPVVSSTFDSEQDSYIPLYGPVDSSRLTTFRQLDVRLDKEFSFDTWKLDLYADVWNVTNAQNEEGRIYDYRYRNFVIVPSYPILPMLGVRGEY